MAQDQAENNTQKSDLLDSESNQLVGSFLQRQRLKKQLTIEEIATETCIHIATLHAIENNNRSKMPAPVFARGFIKLYAEFLGLDSQQIVERYNREADQFEDNISDNPDVFYDEKLAESSFFISPRTVVIVLFFTALCGLGYYFFLYSSPEQQDHVSSLPLEQKFPPAAVTEPEAHSVEKSKSSEYSITMTGDKETIPAVEITEQKEEQWQPEIVSLLEKNTDSVPETKLNDPAGQPPLAEELPLKPEPEPEPEPEILAEAAPLQVIKEDLPPTIRPVAAAEETVEKPPVAEQEKKIQLRIEFTERTWMQVSLDNAAPEQYLFDPAEESSWGADEKIKLHIGNAGGVLLFLNDKELPVGGMSGSPLLLTIPDDLASNN